MIKNCLISMILLVMAASVRAETAKPSAEFPGFSSNGKRESDLDAEALKLVPDPTPQARIEYINPNPPEFKRPEYPGTYYKRLVPATLDLAERARLSVNALTGMLNPNCDYELYMGIDHMHDPPQMRHSLHDMQTVGKYFEVLPLVRSICGSKQNMDAEYGLMKMHLKSQGPDGLIYTPVSGRPWVLPPQTDQNSGILGGQVGIEQFCSIGYGPTRVISALLVYAQKNPKGPWHEAARRLVEGQKKVIIVDGDVAYPFSSWTWLGRKVEKPDPKPHGVLGGQAAWVAKEFVRYDRAIGDPEATELAHKMMRYTLRDMAYIAPNGTFIHDGPPMGNRAHFYTHQMQFLAAFYIIDRTGNKDLLDQSLKAYRYAINEGNDLVGYFPESICHLENKETGLENYGKHVYDAESCELTGMLMTAIMLCHLGYDEWDAVDRWVRNQFAENQLTWTDWLTDGRKNLVEWWETSKPWIAEGQYTFDRVLERTIGGFATHGTPNDWVGFPPNTIFNCCSGSGARGIYFVWRHILNYDKGTLKVNLLLNRASQWVDVDSYIPFTGRVDVKVKKDLNLEIRIPQWVKPDEVKCTVDDKSHKIIFSDRYTQIGKVKSGQTVQLRFPIFERTNKIEIQGEKYTIVRRGNDVVWIDPPGRYCPLYHDRGRYRSGEPQYRKVERFISDESFDWW